MSASPHLQDNGSFESNGLCVTSQHRNNEPTNECFGTHTPLCPMALAREISAAEKTGAEDAASKRGMPPSKGPSKNLHLFFALLALSNFRPIRRLYTWFYFRSLRSLHAHFRSSSPVGNAFLRCQLTAGRVGTDTYWLRNNTGNKKKQTTHICYK